MPLTYIKKAWSQIKVGWNNEYKKYRNGSWNIKKTQHKAFSN